MKKSLQGPNGRLERWGSNRKGWKNGRGRLKGKDPSHLTSEYLKKKLRLITRIQEREVERLVGRAIVGTHGGDHKSTGSRAGSGKSQGGMVVEPVIPT